MCTKYWILIVASILALLVGTLWLTRRTNQTNDQPNWRVNINKGQPKATDEYDVIVVGGGLGGLMLAALLAKENYKVLVLEQASSHRRLCLTHRL